MLSGLQIPKVNKVILRQSFRYHGNSTKTAHSYISKKDQVKKYSLSGIMSHYVLKEPEEVKEVDG